MYKMVVCGASSSATVGRSGLPTQVPLFGAAEALREAVGASPRTIYRGEYERRVATARAALGAEGFCAAWTAGRAMTLEEAIAHGLAESTGHNEVG
jgi:hypothetical protein